jgi:hypothetical protein
LNPTFSFDLRPDVTHDDLDHHHNGNDMDPLKQALAALCRELDANPDGAEWYRARDGAWTLQARPMLKNGRRLPYRFGEPGVANCDAVSAGISRLCAEDALSAALEAYMGAADPTDAGDMVGAFDLLNERIDGACHRLVAAK